MNRTIFQGFLLLQKMLNQAPAANEDGAGDNRRAKTRRWC